LARQARTEFVDTFHEFGDVIRVRMTRVNKRVIGYVAQYEALIEGEFRPVVRFNGSHGFPHRDLLDWSGVTIEKRWAEAGTTMNDAVTEAIRDIRSNWEYYRDQFLRRRP
jgi:hypothetical protein